MLESQKTQTWTTSRHCNMFVDADNKLYNIASNQLVLNLTIDYIKFSDGTVLRLHNKWEQL